jgi:hypothetical protein
MAISGVNPWGVRTLPGQEADRSTQVTQTPLIDPWGRYSSQVGGDGAFPDVGGGDEGVYGAHTVDLGSGLIGVMDNQGRLITVRSADEAGSAYHSPEWRPGEQAMQERQLDQFDRQLQADIGQQQAELAEMRRQFDVTTGLERERLAAEIRMKEKELQNNMRIAELDAGTRLNIANMEAQVSMRGQDISREQFGAEMGARRAEFAISALRNDPVAQAMFTLGETGGTTPLEVAASEFPVMGPVDVRDVDPAKMPKYAAGGTIPVGGVGIVGEAGQPEIAQDIPGGGTRVVPLDPERYRTEYDRIRTIPIAPPRTEYDPVKTTMPTMWGGRISRGGYEDLRRQINEQQQAYDSPEAMRERARETVRTMLEGTFRGDVPLEFGGLPEMEPVFGVQPESPAAMAGRYFNLPLPLQNAMRSTWGVRGMPAEEAFRRMRAATPAGMAPGYRMGYR